MVEVSHVAQPATPSLKQHPYPAEEYLSHTSHLQTGGDATEKIPAEYSNVKSGASTSGLLAEQKQIKKWMDLKTTDTKGKAPAMLRAGGPEHLPLSMQQFITLNITVHSDEPP
ncbi:hypothetical protein T01_8299 [Trichinella spiralis]|uniref:Uncharacterized protein n=1 Tax=Trichinella spiralis TaxID=6334 RepID=A0A0V1ALQ9_TRISP|nr:hypothetical protein T01_8299 [Trichinella spiralis]